MRVKLDLPHGFSSWLEDEGVNKVSSDEPGMKRQLEINKAYEPLLLELMTLEKLISSNEEFFDARQTAQASRKTSC